MTSANSEVGDQKGKTALGSAHSEYRQYSGPINVVTKLLSVGLALFILLYVSGILPQAGVYFIFFQFNGIFLAGILCLVFLLVPARKGLARDKLPWYDLLLIACSLACCLYIAVNAAELAYFTALTASTPQTMLGVIAIGVLLEAIRRTLGWSMVVVLAVLLLHTRFGFLLPDFPLSVREFGWRQILAIGYLSYTGMFGSLTTLTSHTIFTFIAFGIFFMKVGGAEVFLNLALSLTGHLRGGPAKAAIVGSAAFGTLSSSPLANVAVSGSITIPMMIRTGYSPTFAAAVETIASTGGQIMPPIMGSIAFIMAALLGVSYVTICLAAIIPASLYFVALFIQTDLRAAKEGLRGLPRSQLPSFWATVRDGWEFGIPLVTLMVLLFALRYPPPLAATYALGTLIPVSFLRKKNRLSWKGLAESLDEATRSVLVVAPTIAAAGIITGLLGMSGLGPKFASSLVALSGGNNLVLVVLAAVASYVLGMGGAMIINYILLTVMISPALELVGVPLMVSHFFVFYVGLTMFFTPPFCPAAFIAAGIAKDRPFAVGLQAMRLGIVTFLVPVILIYNPALILIGEPVQIAFGVVTALIGVFALSVGIERYFLTRTTWWQTVLALGAGVMMMVPEWITDVIGAGLMVIVIVWQWRSRRLSGPVVETAG